MLCYYCKKEINENELVKYGGKNYHYNCFINKEKNKKRGRKTDLEIKQQADLLLQESVELNRINQLKDEFYKYIQSTYEITLIPTYTFMKMNEIFSGTYKGLDKPIDVENLLYMFKSKKSMLDKIYSNNVSKGKKIDNLGRFNYDLAIMLGKYDSYIEWKEKYKTQEVQEITKEEATNMFDINKIIQQQNLNVKDYDDIDINDLVDEI